MYYGSAKDAIDWFDRLGYTLPYGINAADFILDLSSSDVGTQKRCTAAAGQKIFDVSLTVSSSGQQCVITMATNMPLRFAPSHTVDLGEGSICVGGETCGGCQAADD